MCVFPIFAVPISRSKSGNDLYEQRDALPAPDAERDQTPPKTIALHGMEQTGGQDRARRADRMAMCDRTTLDIDDILGQAQFTGHGDRDRGKSLVDLHALQIRYRPAGAGECLTHCRDWPQPKQSGLYGADAERDQACGRRHAVPVSPGLASDDHSVMWTVNLDVPFRHAVLGFDRHWDNSTVPTSGLNGGFVRSPPFSSQKTSAIETTVFCRVGTSA